MSSQGDEAAGTPATRRAWGAVVPAKRLATAKSRLVELGDDVRRDLVVAFLHDTLSAVLECSRVGLVVVVTDDLILARTAGSLGAWPIPDGHGGDLNASLVQGAAEVERRLPGVGVVATLADLPALRGDDLEGWLTTEPAADAAVVADEVGTGTTVLRARLPGTFLPAFGPGSRAAHVAAGARDLTGAAAAGMRRDVDTPSDLLVARGLGVGERTRWVLTRHGL
jgi:2-phospho-L-lactate guanylyltransferase